MIDGARCDLTRELIEHLVVPYFSREANNAANIQLEVMDNGSGREFSQLEAVLHVFHIASHKLIPGDPGGPIKHVVSLRHQLSPVGGRGCSQVYADQAVSFGILVSVEDDHVLDW